ncbi:unnamed protein product [Durusdinium trenchii]|uniref:RNA-directed DNA polymerase n=1 Tax=Durusdinium trenchii TaxID=1381693 RepID=A0ABP0M5I2_9DINO
MSNTVRKWPILVQTKRKPRAKVERKKPEAPPLLLPAPRASGKDLGQLAQSAADPASLDAAQPVSDRVGSAQAPAGVDALAKRLACGRTAAVLQRILQFNPFKIDEEDEIPPFRGGAPCRGMTANLPDGSMVFIVDTFLRRGVLHADIAMVKSSSAGAGRFSLGRLSTVKADALSSVRVELIVADVRGRDVRLRRDARQQNVEMLQLALPAVCPPVSEPRISNGNVIVGPLAATEHTARFGTSGCPHQTVPREERVWSGWILDIPSSVPFVAEPRRCASCRYSAVSEIDDKDYFPVLAQDVLRAFPHAVVVDCPRQKRQFMSRRYLFEIALQFYASLNCKEVRRQLMAIAVTQALSADMVWRAYATPKSQALRWIVMKVFGKTMQGMVGSLQAKLFVYNGQGLRHDGNMGIANRVALRNVQEGARRRLSKKKHLLGRRKRCGRVVLAVTGVDGCLLAPPVIAKTESNNEIVAALTPLLLSIKNTRLRAGCTLEESVPAFHATDNYYRGQRLRLAQLYRAIWPDLRVRSWSRTRKGNAVRREVLGEESLALGCSIVGDPQHDVINLSKLLHGRAADKEDLLRDHQELLHRLSGPEAPNKKDFAVPQADLSAPANELLTSACVEPLPAFTQTAARLKCAHAEVKDFLAQPRVQESRAWLDPFRAYPPRGTLARIARRVGATLHPSSEACGWRSEKEFRREARRIRRWYRGGRKTMRRSVGLPRTDGSPHYVRGLKTAWTKKVGLHYKRFFGRIRQEGLWAWRQVSRALRLANISQQSGTVSVERVWSYYKAALPVGNRIMAKDYFDLLSGLLFVRYCLTHAKANRLPPWLERDSLMATKLDAVIAYARDGARDCSEAFR